MRHAFSISIWATLSILFLTGCSEEARKRLEPTPIAVGSLNQLAVIADDDIWDGPVGDSINYYFGSAFPILPQPEPLFDLRHFTAEGLELEPARRELKAYLIVGDIGNISSGTGNMVANAIGSEKVARAMDDPTYSTNVGRDRWAKGQLLVYLFANGEENLADQVVKKFPSIAKAIQNQYQEQIDASVYLGGANNAVVNEIQDSFGLYMKIPSDYRINLVDKDFMWIVKEGDVAIYNIMIHERPYTSQDQFKKDNMIALRDTLGKYISTTIPGTYMQINDIDLPVLSQSMQMAESYAIEARGIWEMVGDFLGGPFVSYQILDEVNGRLVFIDGFILAPNEKKRNFMLYLEHILHSIALKRSAN